MAWHLICWGERRHLHFMTTSCISANIVDAFHRVGTGPQTMNTADNEAQVTPAPQILLVDDEEEILPEYQEFLELKGLESAICANPQKAVELVLAQPDFRVVVTDFRMAKLDGASLIRALRSALPAERHVDFMILTVDATLQTSDDLADVPVFIKPADTDALVAAIRSALTSKQ